MTEAEEPKFNSLADRIAALNKQPNFTAPKPSTVGKRPPPPPPGARPQQQSRSQTSHEAQPQPQKSPILPARPQRNNAPPLPTRRPSSTNASNQDGNGEAPPPLPNRTASNLSPALPPRRPSSTQQLSVRRRGSNSSDMSHLSTLSAVSASATSLSSVTGDTPSRKLPPRLEDTKLPPLPPTRRELAAQAQARANDEAEAVPGRPIPSNSAPTVPIEPPTRPSLPPRLPSRPAKSTPKPVEHEPPPPTLPTRRLPPPPTSYSRPKTFDPPPRPNGNRPSPRPAPADDAPPPVPMASRPSIAQMQIVEARPSPVGPAHAVSSAKSVPTPAADPNSCLICRDFSGPDSVAAQYPRQSLPHRPDLAGYLAHVLCSPFPSHTDKARAIFTWCHHNIAYDTASFFSGNIKSPVFDDLLRSGLAVCSGYAEIFKTIAERAGLEVAIVSGHGKGYGHQNLKHGDQTPKVDYNHAWNAVRIDGGEWKLIDCCWGAGHLDTGAGNVYKAQFTPTMFTLSNERFGMTHFPENPRWLLRADGRVLTWEQYIWGDHPKGLEQPRWYGNAREEGFDQFNYEPQTKYLSVSSPSPTETLRFQFGRLCEHWDPERNGKGKPYLVMLEVHGIDGRKKETPLLNQDRFWYWLDVPRRELGAPGQKVKLMILTQLNGMDGRGLRREQWLNKGCGGWSFSYLTEWELVR